MQHIFSMSERLLEIWKFQIPPLSHRAVPYSSDWQNAKAKPLQSKDWPDPGHGKCLLKVISTPKSERSIWFTPNTPSIPSGKRMSKLRFSHRHCLEDLTRKQLGNLWQVVHPHKEPWKSSDPSKRLERGQSLIRPQWCTCGNWWSMCVMSRGFVQCGRSHWF